MVPDCPNGDIVCAPLGPRFDDERSRDANRVPNRRSPTVGLLCSDEALESESIAEYLRTRSQVGISGQFRTGHDVSFPAFDFSIYSLATDEIPTLRIGRFGFRPRIGAPISIEVIIAALNPER